MIRDEIKKEILDIDAHIGLLNDIKIDLQKKLKINKLISIGWLGVLKCYLNVDKDEAIKRYCESQKISIEEFEDSNYNVEEFEFTDTFDAYDVWEDEDE